MHEFEKKLGGTSSALKTAFKSIPKWAIVLGSGLGAILEQLIVEAELPFQAIPYFKQTTVVGHHGKLVVAKLSGVPVLFMLGRLHYYEGHTPEEIVYPVRALASAGVENFLLTNAAGGLLSEMVPPEFVVIEDHINLQGFNPLRGPNIESLGERFPDMTFAYDREWNQVLLQTAQKTGVKARGGVYVGVPGPSFETPAETRMHRQLGGTVAGMSTIPEVTALRHMGKRVTAISVVTNLASGLTNEPLTHEEVLVNGKKALGDFSKWMKAFYLECAGTGQNG